MVRHARGIYEIVTQYRAENHAPSLEYRDFVLKPRLRREIDEARLLISRSHTISIGLHIEQIGKLTEFLIKLEIAANAAETLVKWDNAGGPEGIELDEDEYVEHIRTVCAEIGDGNPEVSIATD